MEGQLSKDAAYKLEVVAGKLVVTAKLDSEFVDANVKLEIDGNAVIDALALAVPGDSIFEQLTVAGLKTALAGVKI